MRTEKRCTKCRIVKPVDDFYRKAGTMRPSARCKECTRAAIMNARRRRGETEPA